MLHRCHARRSVWPLRSGDGGLRLARLFCRAIRRPPPGVFSSASVPLPPSLEGRTECTVRHARVVMPAGEPLDAAAPAPAYEAETEAPVPLRAITVMIGVPARRTGQRVREAARGVDEKMRGEWGRGNGGRGLAGVEGFFGAEFLPHASDWRGVISTAVIAGQILTEIDTCLSFGFEAVYRSNRHGIWREVFSEWSQISAIQ